MTESLKLCTLQIYYFVIFTVSLE